MRQRNGNDAAVAATLQQQRDGSITAAVATT